MAFKLKHSNSPLHQAKSVIDNTMRNIAPKPTVTYGTPEYAEAYKKGEVVTKEGVRSPISLDEVVVSKKSPKKGFWKQSTEHYAKEHKDDGVLGAIGSVVTYPMEVAQHAMTYGLTGKVQKPSTALNIKNRVGATAVDILADPTILAGAISKAPKAIKAVSETIKGGELLSGAKKAIGSGELINAAKTGISKIAKDIKVGVQGPSALNREEYVSKFLNKGIPEGTRKSIVSKTEKALHTNLNWIESAEYATKRAANTGESLGSISRDVSRMKNRFMNTRIRGLQEEGVKGMYMPSKEGTADMIRINFEDFAKKGWKGTLEHEIGHALSPTGKAGSISTAAERSAKKYKNYPTLEVPETEAYKNYAGIKTPQEQQARLIKMNRMIKKHAGIGPGEDITEAHFSNWKTKVMSDPAKKLERTHGDVHDYLNITEALNPVKKIVGTVNKAWMAPAVVGGLGLTAAAKKK